MQSNLEKMKRVEGFTNLTKSSYTVKNNQNDVVNDIRIDKQIKETE